MKSEGKSDDSEHINRTVRSRDTLKVEEVGWQGMTKWPLKIWCCKQTHSLVLMITLDCPVPLRPLPCGQHARGSGRRDCPRIDCPTRIDAYYGSHGSIN
jgi:hypothetical protein